MTIISGKLDNDFNSSKPKAIKRVEIFENEFLNQINPFEIVNLEDEMIICDMGNYDIYRVSSNGNSYSKFGDYYIQEILNKYRSQKENIDINNVEIIDADGNGIIWLKMN